ncbi:MAG TPA: flagellar basal body-associated protein FliL [Casimicrobiaceae bacterium]|nr:flagellar basal body-associated protein FliL [Casimicrobiaceae bacterium]
MAKTATVTPMRAEVAGAAAAAPAKSGRKWLFIAVALVAVLAIGGAGWYFLAPHAAAEAKAAAPKPPVFVPLDAFTVNLAEENGDHYLQVGIVYQVSDDKVVDTMKQYMPVLRNRILLLLSSKKPSDLASVDGKRKLVDELVAAVKDAMPLPTGQEVRGALLSSFVIQ